MKLKMLSPWKKSCDQCRQHIKKKRHYFPDKDLDSQSYGFSNSYVWIWELDRKKAEHWRIDAFELWCQRKLLRVPWTAAHQASLSITNSWSLLMSTESVMPSNNLILCHTLLLLPSIFPRIRVFSNESVLPIRWPKYWSFIPNTSFPLKSSNFSSHYPIRFRLKILKSSS